jgi:hypothetical protein
VDIIPTSSYPIIKKTSHGFNICPPWSIISSNIILGMHIKLSWYIFKRNPCNVHHYRYIMHINFHNWRMWSSWISTISKLIFRFPQIDVYTPQSSKTRPKNEYPMTDPCNYAIYGVPWIPSTKTPLMLAFFYQHQPDPTMWGPQDSWAGL